MYCLKINFLIFLDWSKKAALERRSKCLSLILFQPFKCYLCFNYLNYSSATNENNKMITFVPEMSLRLYDTMCDTPRNKEPAGDVRRGCVRLLGDHGSYQKFDWFIFVCTCRLMMVIMLTVRNPQWSWPLRSYHPCILIFWYAVMFAFVLMQLMAIVVSHFCFSVTGSSFLWVVIERWM